MDDPEPPPTPVNTPSSRPRPCYRCFCIEFTEMYRKIQEGEDPNKEARLPVKWHIKPCEYKNDGATRKCQHCSSNGEPCLRVPGLAEGDYNDVLNTISYLSSLTELADPATSRHVLNRTARANMVKSAAQLAVGFQQVVSNHLGEHNIRSGSSAVLKPWFDIYNGLVRERRLQLAAAQDGGDGRPRLNGHDRDYEAWQTFVRGFRRNLREGLRVASLSDEAIDNIIQDLPIVEDTIRNMVPDALAHWLITNTQAAAPSGTS